jgi:hypothetical protein
VIDGSKFKAVNNRDRNFTKAKMERRLAQIEESVARNLQQLDSADRQEPSQARTTKTVRLKKIAKLKEEVKRLHGLTSRSWRQSGHSQPRRHAPRPQSTLTPTSLGRFDTTKTRSCRRLLANDA